MSLFIMITLGTLMVIPIIFYANRIPNMFEDNDHENKSYELGSVNNGFNNDNYSNGINVIKITTKQSENKRNSLVDFELVYRKNSFTAL